MAKDKKDKDEDFDMFKLGYKGIIAWAEQSVKESDEKREREEKRWQ